MVDVRDRNMNSDEYLMLLQKLAVKNVRKAVDMLERDLKEHGQQRTANGAVDALNDTMFMTSAFIQTLMRGVFDTLNENHDLTVSSRWMQSIANDFLQHVHEEYGQAAYDEVKKVINNADGGISGKGQDA